MVLIVTCLKEGTRQMAPCGFSNSLILLSLGGRNIGVFLLMAHFIYGLTMWCAFLPTLGRKDAVPAHSESNF